MKLVALVGFLVSSLSTPAWAGFAVYVCQSADGRTGGAYLGRATRTRPQLSDLAAREIARNNCVRDGCSECHLQTAGDLQACVAVVQGPTIQTRTDRFPIFSTWAEPFTEGDGTDACITAQERALDDCAYRVSRYGLSDSTCNVATVFGDRPSRGTVHSGSAR
jgi:hypothetical protein